MKKLLIIICLPLISIAQPDIKLVEQEFIQILNEYRVSHGVQVLHVSDDATRVAEFQNNYLAEINLNENTLVVTHNHPDYKSFSQRVRTIMGDLEFLNAGENVGAQNVPTSPRNKPLSAKDLAMNLFNLWKDSPAHNENMLDPTYNYTGISITYINHVNIPPNRMKQAFNEYGQIILVPANDPPTYSICIIATNVFVNFPN